MDEDLRSKLVTAVQIADDFESLKEMLLSLLLPAATDNEEVSVQVSQGVATRSHSSKGISVKLVVANTADRVKPTAATPGGKSETKGIVGGVKSKGASPATDGSVKPKGASTKRKLQVQMGLAHALTSQEH